MRLRYSYHDIFWNKDNELKPNKTGFNRFIDNMETATNFNVNYVSELSVKITIPSDNIWKFIEIDDMSGTKFARKYYVLGTITKKNRVNCECIFVVDIWCSFILNNFNSFYTNRTNYLTHQILPNNTEFLVPKTTRGRIDFSVYNINDGLHPDELRPIDEPSAKKDRRYYNTNFTHIFYDTSSNRYLFVFNPSGGIKNGYPTNDSKYKSYPTDKMISSKMLTDVIGKSINIPKSTKIKYPFNIGFTTINGVLQYVSSFFGPHYMFYKNRKVIKINATEPAFNNDIWNACNKHLLDPFDKTGKALHPILYELQKANLLYCVESSHEILNPLEHFRFYSDNNNQMVEDETMKYILSNMETNYCSATITNLDEPVEIKILDQVCMSNDNFVSMIKTSIPYIQDGFFQTIKQTGTSFNTSLQIAERSRDLQKHINITKSTFNAVESFIGGGASMITGLATGNAKMLVQGANSAVFGTAGAIMDGVLGDMQIENQYQNTLDRAKAQRADAANNATGQFTTYMTSEINYFGFWNELLEPSENEQMYVDRLNYYGDLNLARRYFKWYGYACVPYEQRNTDDLESYIRVYSNWLDIQTQYYVGLTPTEIQAVKRMLVQGVRVSTQGSIVRELEDGQIL